jgi:hypothetical protein
VRETHFTGEKYRGRRDARGNRAVERGVVPLEWRDTRGDVRTTLLICGVRDVHASTSPPCGCCRLLRSAAVCFLAKDFRDVGRDHGTSSEMGMEGSAAAGVWGGVRAGCASTFKMYGVVSVATPACLSPSLARASPASSPARFSADPPFCLGFASFFQCSRWREGARFWGNHPPLCGE